MKLLYNEMDTNLNYEMAKIEKIKPVVKVDSPEAEAFFKSVLSKQDKKVQTQQECLETRILNLNSLENQVRAARNEFENKINQADKNHVLILGKLEIVQNMLNSMAEKDNNEPT
jgi:hypothetical protein